jgi:hypothetical protein
VLQSRTQKKWRAVAPCGTLSPFPTQRNKGRSNGHWGAWGPFRTPDILQLKTHRAKSKSIEVVGDIGGLKYLLPGARPDKWNPDGNTRCDYGRPILGAGYIFVLAKKTSAVEWSQPARCGCIHPGYFQHTGPISRLCAHVRPLCGEAHLIIGANRAIEN